MEGHDRFEGLDDKEIWFKILDQNKDALSYFFKKYYSFLFHYGMKIHQDKRVVEDTIQDIYYKFWKKSEKLAGVSNPKSYILKSFKNALLDRIKKIGSLKSEDSFSFLHEEYTVQDRMIEDEAKEELRKKISRGLDLLPPRQREIIYLRFYRDLEYEEIADLLGINYQSVRNSVHTSIKALRQSLISLLAFLGDSLF